MTGKESEAASGTPGGPPQPGSKHLRLPFLDGMRGFAALYVLVYHTYCRVTYSHVSSTISPAVRLWTRGLAYGHYAVVVFIVLSGYCLGLPVVRSAGKTIEGGLSGFMRRRALRILPAYYAALAGVVLLLWATVHFHLTNVAESSQLREQLSAGSLVSHLFLVHNFDSNYAKYLDPPMWSVATEADIYVVFALALVPIYARFGGIAMAAAGGAAALLPYYFLPASSNLGWAFPWLLGSFGLGFLAADASFGARPWREQFRVPWGALAGGSLAAYSGLALWLPCQPLAGLIVTNPPWLVDALVSLGTAACIGWLAEHRRATRGERAPTLGAAELLCRCFESGTGAALGAFSYSLYLIHQPIEECIYKVLFRRGVGTFEMSVLFALGVVPAVMALAWAFSLAFERPFLRWRKKTSAVRERDI